MTDTITQLRQTFLQFYRARDHRILKSSPLVPKEDPTLLFTSAGMVQFKKNYASKEPLEFRRVATIQKCFRASDLDSVGHTPRHLTFFEMLGHFSFGDYYKREAIVWNWEFFTQVYKLPPEKLKVSVYQEDDEAFEIWRTVIGLPPEKIYRLGKKDNFWGPAGDTGACGPNSEIYYDLGQDLWCGKAECGPGCDCDRWVEIGNCVFPQYDMQPDGTLAPLANRGIDTGIGLERVSMVLEGKRTLFDTTAFRPLIAMVEEMAGQAYEDPYKSAFNIIADHIRGLTFALTEGVLPSNEGRGYVIRRILRRAAVQGHRLGLTRPFLAELSRSVVDRMGEAYPELREAAPAVRMSLQLEEERFRTTLEQGLTLFEEAAARAGTGGAIPGPEIFLLYDTFGFPTDLTALLARERGLEVDLAGFEQAMTEQRERSRRGAKFYRAVAGESLEWVVLSEGAHSVFRGYETLELEARIRRYAPMAAGEDAKTEREREYWVILDETPFYAEAGGQVGDQGILSSPGFRARVLDAQKQEGEIRHRIVLEEGSFPEGVIQAQVLSHARYDTMRNHTATHLLHAALRQVLGSHVSQAGSRVTSDRLRFDFTYPKAVTGEDLARIEDLVNERVLLDEPVGTVESGYDEAIRDGVMALFGEKYGDRVRRVEINGYSRELCGGTHVARTGQIGAFLVSSESGIAAGIRRIEAVTGQGAVREARRLSGILHGALESLPGVMAELPDRVKALYSEAAKLRKQIQELKNRGPEDALAGLMNGLRRLGRGSLLVGTLEVEEGTDLRALGDRIRQRISSGAGLIAVRAGEKTTLLAVVTDDLVEGKLLKADDIVRKAASQVGGSGGGRPHLAMAGVGDPRRTDEALEAGRSLMTSALTG
jgi:alanyl-tRNA synthetase